MVTTCSKRLGPVSDAQFQRALDRFDLGTFVKAEPTSGGLFGQNVFVSSSKGEFVLRGCPHYDWQFPKERFFARSLAERTSVPAPWPYLYEPSTDIFGWSYAFMPRLPGETADVDRGAEDNLAIARAMGANLAECQTLSWPHAGEYSLEIDDIQPYPNGYEAWVMDDVRGQLDRCGRLACVRPEETQWAESVVASAAGAWSEDWQPCFVQNDYGLNNVFVERDGEGWRVSGLFDLMECRCGDGECDLVRLAGRYLGKQPPCGRELAVEFLRAYGERRPLRPGHHKRFRVHALRNMLTFWEYGHSMAKWFPADLSLRPWAEPAVESLPGLIG